jgi:hypothetical protein
VKEQPEQPVISSSFQQLLWQIIKLALTILGQPAGNRFERFQFTIGPTTNKGRKTNTVILNFTSTQKVKVHLAPIDDEVPPQPAPVDGVPVWTVIDGDVTLDVAADGLSANVISGAPDVVSHVGLSADADPGTGVQTITDTIECHVSHPLATNLGLTADAPVPK